MDRDLVTDLDRGMDRDLVTDLDRGMDRDLVTGLDLESVRVRPAVQVRPEGRAVREDREVPVGRAGQADPEAPEQGGRQAAAKLNN